jgi:hypothetical protein
MENYKIYLIFFGVAFLSAIVSTLGFDFFARIFINNEHIIIALSNSLDLLKNPIGSILLIMPFFLIALGCASTYKAGKKSKAYCQFIVCLLLVIALYFMGQITAIHAEKQKKWTGAALSLGMLPFASIGLIYIGALIGALISNIVDRFSHRMR